MSTREQFGKYLLLKKLSEDPLGETFRAGTLGDKGMESVVLLRVFDGQGIDGNRLWEAVKSRTAIQQALKSPNIGDGVEMGAIEGIPFVAYDYISGKNLSDLFTQAATKKTSIPVEHALLITERIALALSVAAESRLEGERILHGFLVPHLVMISNEGETRLLGFDVGPGLRSMGANPVVRQHFGRYLAPEAMSGAAPDRADDVYSLGVLLFELLGGQPLPPPGPDGYGAVIANAKLAADETPLPAPVVELLKKSLVAREGRLQDVAEWHKTLNKFMYEGQYNPTTFNLAFFMHNLFRQEIERESQEIEVEKTMPLPVGQLPVELKPAAAVPPETGVQQPPSSGTWTGVRSEPPPAASSGSRTALWVSLAALVVLGGGGGGAWWYLGQRSAAASDSPTTAPMTAPPPAAELSEALTEQPEEPPPVEPEPTGPSPQEVQAQIDALIEQKASAMEAQLRQHYDQQLKGLESELDNAKRAAAEREQALREQQRLAEQRAREAEAARAERQAATAPPPSALRAETELAGASAGDQGGGAPADPAAEPTTGGADGGTPTQLAQQAPPPGTSPPTDPQATGPPSTEPLTGAPPPRLTPPPPPPPVRTRPARPEVRRGDLVRVGTPGLIPPVLEREPEPRFPAIARRLNKRGVRVDVRVLVDENGRIATAELEGDKVGYGFDTEALSAAKKAQFKPAVVNGVPVKIWVTLKIQFN